MTTLRDYLKDLVDEVLEAQDDNELTPDSEELIIDTAVYKIKSFFDKFLEN